METAELKDEIFTNFGFCGCGDPESALQFLLEILQLIKDRADAANNTEKYNKLYEDIEEKLHFKSTPGLFWLFLYMLDQKGLTEHGGTVRGCWLTDEGEKLLASIKEIKALDGDKYVWG